MEKPPEPTFVAFAGFRRVERGTLADVALAAKRHTDADQRLDLYDERTGRTFDVDLRGSEADVVARLAEHPLAEAPKPAGRRGPGRPKLGVISREISLLPRHWEWLAKQPGSASATLRKLVERARADATPDLEARRAVEAAHQFMWDIAGDLPGFEAVSRALFARDWSQFDALSESWPADVRAELALLTAPAR